jgi:hypothetical protein
MTCVHGPRHDLRPGDADGGHVRVPHRDARGRRGVADDGAGVRLGVRGRGVLGLQPLLQDRGPRRRGVPRRVRPGCAAPPPAAECYARLADSGCAAGGGAITLDFKVRAPNYFQHARDQAKYIEQLQLQCPRAAYEEPGEAAATPPRPMLGGEAAAGLHARPATAAFRHATDLRQSQSVSLENAVPAEHAPSSPPQSRGASRQRLRGAAAGDSSLSAAAPASPARPGGPGRAVLTPENAGKLDRRVGRPAPPEPESELEAEPEPWAETELEDSSEPLPEPEDGSELGPGLDVPPGHDRPRVDPVALTPDSSYSADSTGSLGLGESLLDTSSLSDELAVTVCLNDSYDPSDSSNDGDNDDPAGRERDGSDGDWTAAGLVVGAAEQAAPAAAWARHWPAASALAGPSPAGSGRAGDVSDRHPSGRVGPAPAPSPATSPDTVTAVARRRPTSTVCLPPSRLARFRSLGAAQTHTRVTTAGGGGQPCPAAGGVGVARHPHATPGADRRGHTGAGHPGAGRAKPSLSRRRYRCAGGGDGTVGACRRLAALAAGGWACRIRQAQPPAAGGWGRRSCGRRRHRACARREGLTDPVRRLPARDGLLCSRCVVPQDDFQPGGIAGGAVGAPPPPPRALHTLRSGVCRPS